jgi:Spy/CpxP family protein refolding chaperone
LTEEQVKKLQTLQANFQKETLELRKNILSKSMELQQLWIADELDENAISEKAKEISALQSQIQEKMIRHRLDAAKVLTKEQRAQLSIMGGLGRGYGGFGAPGCGMGRGFGVGGGRWNW